MNHERVRGILRGDEETIRQNAQEILEVLSSDASMASWADEHLSLSATFALLEAAVDEDCLPLDVPEPEDAVVDLLRPFLPPPLQRLVDSVPPALLLGAVSAVSNLIRRAISRIQPGVEALWASAPDRTVYLGSSSKLSPDRILLEISRSCEIDEESPHCATLLSIVFEGMLRAPRLLPHFTSIAARNESVVLKYVPVSERQDDPALRWRPDSMLVDNTYVFVIAHSKAWRLSPYQVHCGALEEFSRKTFGQMLQRTEEDGRLISIESGGLRSIMSMAEVRSMTDGVLPAGIRPLGKFDRISSEVGGQVVFEGQGQKRSVSGSQLAAVRVRSGL